MTPKSSIYNISVDDSFSAERGPEVSLENPMIAGHGMSLPFKYSQVSLASGKSQASGRAPRRSPNVSMDPAILPVTMQPSWKASPAMQMRNTSKGNTNHSNSTPASLVDNHDNINQPETHKAKNLTFQNPSFDDRDVIVPINIKPITASPDQTPQTLYQLHGPNSLSTNHNLPRPTRPTNEQKLNPNQRSTYNDHSGAPPLNNKLSPPGPLVRSHAPVRHTLYLPPGHPARTMSPVPSGGRSTPVNITPTKCPSTMKRQLSPSDEWYRPDIHIESPLTLPMPYSAPVIPLEMHRKSYNASAESIPYIDQSGLDLSLRRF